MFKHQTGIHRTLTFIIIGTREAPDFLLVQHQQSFYGMGVVLLLEIDHLRADITNGTAFVGHIVHSQVTDNGNLTVGILDDVEVTIQCTRHAWCIGDDGGDFVEVELMEGDGEVLQGRGVGFFGIDLHTHAVIGSQVNLGLHLT